MRIFWQDLSFGLRLLRGNPGFAAIAVLTLAVGIAANTTVFSWIDGLLWHPFGGANDGQLAVLEMITAGAPNGANQTSYLDYRDYRTNLRSISGLAVHREDVFRLGDAANAQPVWGELVSGNYFSVLQVPPVLGRAFNSEEDSDHLGAYPVAVISHRLWRSRFHSDPGVIGQTLRVNSRELTVVGVAPRQFRGTMPGLAFDIWVPVTMGPELGLLGESVFRHRGARCLYALARLKPDVTISQARAEAATLAHNLELANPKTNRAVSATILPVWRFHSAAPDLLLRPLQILMAISALVLLIVCANVANLLLARSAGRRKELSVRLALGAGSLRLARQLLTESLLLAGAGAVLGLFLAVWAGDLLPGLVPKINAPVAAGFRMNGRVLAFTLLVCALAALVSSAAPALVWFRADVNELLKETGRSGGQGARSLRMRNLLVISEVAMATLALIGAGLFLRSFQNARAIFPGFDRSNVLLVRFYPANTRYSMLELQQFCSRLRESLRSDPGVADVSYSDYPPLGASSGPYDGVQVEGYAPAPEESMEINRYLVAPGYFRLLRIPLLEGRDFTDRDDWNSAPVMIVNRAFQERYFPGAAAVGRRVQCWGRWHTVVGVAQNSKYFSISEAPRPHFFAPFRQQAGPDRQVYFFIRTIGDPAAVIPGLHREIASVDPNGAAFDVMTLLAWTEVTLLPQKAAASLLAALGAIALLLASVGLYSVMAYSVSQRTQEIGIRMALGARPRDVLREVLRQGITLTAIGLAAGIAAALALARLVAGQLVDVGAADLKTFAGASVFLTLIALLASYVPARRATRVEPITALHSE